MDALLLQENAILFSILEFNSVVDRLADMTTATMDSMVVHHDSWTSQIKDVTKIEYPFFLFPLITLYFYNELKAMNVNGGDIENATTCDYVMHFLTFGWKVEENKFKTGQLNREKQVIT